MIPEPEVALDYWQHYASMDYAKTHSVQQLAGSGFDMRRAIPLHVHMDGTKVFKGSGMNIESLMWSISSVLSPKMSAFLCKYWLGQIPVHQHCNGTNGVVVSMLRWQFAVLATGRNPRLGYYREELTDRGKPGDEFAGGYIAVYAGTKSDAKEKRVQHGCHSSAHLLLSGTSARFAHDILHMFGFSEPGCDSTPRLRKAQQPSRM